MFKVSLHYMKYLACCQYKLLKYLVNFANWFAVSKVAFPVLRKVYFQGKDYRPPHKTSPSRHFPEKNLFCFRFSAS